MKILAPFAIVAISFGGKVDAWFGFVIVRNISFIPYFKIKMSKSALDN